MTFPSYMSWQFPDYVPRPGAERFDPGWLPSGSIAGLLESLSFASDVGPERFEHAREVSDLCRELLSERVEVVSEPGQATLVTWLADDPAQVVEKLAERGVVVRDLPGTGWVRASCGFWTSEDDLQRLAEGL
jgi:selenocysteine lyase/cysteine desulfurase